MEELEKVKKFLPFLLPSSIFILIIFIVMMVSSASSGDMSILVTQYFVAPFSDKTEYTITSPYGSRIDPISNEKKFHFGIDMSAPENTNITSSASGTVVKVGYEKDGSGNYVIINHHFDGITFQTLYAHMLDNSIVVSEGQEVQQREKIGVIGDTGYTTGIHCHFEIHSPEVKYDGMTVIDPTLVVKK